MRLNQTLLALATASTAVAGPIILDRRQGTTQGVNLGGWLVLEPWITPSIFQQYDASVVDEYTLCQQGNAESVLQSHWATWVTQGDFQRIAGSGKGINLVRIPIGYWAFEKYGGDTYIQGAKDYLAQALEWASQSGLQVWIDLHGAPRSQNGFDNSGQVTGSPGFTSGDTNSFMAGVVGQVASEFGSHPAVVGIELVNEPLIAILPGGRSGLEDYYNQGSGAASSTGKSIILSDGFEDPSTWNGEYPGAILDHHDYQVFSMDDVSLSYQEHVDTAYSRAAEFGQSDKPVIVGEWTAAMTDCAYWLNGRNYGARYDGTLTKNGETSYYVGSCDGKNDLNTWDQGLRDATRNYIQAQTSAYSSSADGWIFWNFKTEGAAEWDFFRLVDAGIWP